MVIGSGGKTIREIEEKTGATLSIEEDGTVVVSGPGDANVQKAVAIVEGLTKEVEVGEIYEGEVKKVVDFGAFVEIIPGKEGLLHVSELAYEYVADVYSVIKEGDIVKVKVVDTSPDGKIALSKKALEEPPEGVVQSDQDGQYNRNKRRSSPRRGRPRRR